MLGRNMKEYTYFSYEVNEALHLSETERSLVVDSLRKIRLELGHAIDRHSRRLVTTQIEVLLDYCLRFYERQFITRAHVNHDVLTRFERLLDDYFAEGRARSEGLPTVKLLRRTALPLAQLFRRPGQARDGAHGSGAYPAQAARGGEGAGARSGADDR